MGFLDIFRKSKEPEQDNNNYSGYDVYFEHTKHKMPDYSGWRRRSNYVFDATSLEVKKALSSDATLRQIVSRYTELTMSQGFQIRSNDASFDKYLQSRIREIETASAKKMSAIIERSMRNLVAYGNAFIYIKRDANNSSGESYLFPKGDPGMNLDPISSMYVIDPYAMSIKRGKYGTVISYHHDPDMFRDNLLSINYDEDIITVPTSKSSQSTTFTATDIVHAMYEASDYAFGRSFLVEALEDLLLLRMIESTMAYMIENKEFFVTVHKIGTKEAPGTAKHIQEIKSIIESSPVNGEIIVPGNQEIEIKEISTLNDVMNYAEYFKKRYFSAVGMSTVGMGEPGAANRATADRTNEAMYDKARSFQRAMAEAFETQFLDHIVYDYGMKPEKMPESERPKLIFPDPDLERVKAIENQAIFDYTNNAITEDEMRNRLKMEPVEDRSKMFFDLITLRQMEENAKFAEKYAPKQANPSESSNRANPKNQYSK